MQLIDLTGKRFGKLTIISRASTPGAKHVRWNAVCDCGVRKTVHGDAVKRGTSRSCGCIRQEQGSWNRGIVREQNHVYRGIGAFSASHYGDIKYKATKRRLEFSVTHERLWELFNEQGGVCALSGIPLHFESYSKANDATASLDRIDSSKGYVEGNVQWVYRSINFMKGKMTDEQFIEVCKRVAEYNR